MLLKEKVRLWQICCLLTAYSRISFFKLVTFFLSFFNIQKHQFFLVKLIGQWIWDGDGREISRDVKKKFFSFSKLDKKWLQSWDNLQSWDPSLNFSFLNCSSFLTILCQFLKLKIFFFEIPSYPPPIAVGNSMTNKLYQKKSAFLYIFHKKKVQNWSVQKGPYLIKYMCVLQEIFFC